MKIALTIEHFEPGRGGGETYARNFARLLLKEGHEVHVFALSWDRSEKGPIFHQIPPPPMRLWRRYFFATRARNLVSEGRFDIIHGFGKSICMDVFRPGGGVHRAWMAHELRATTGGLARLGARLRQAFSVDQRLVLRLERSQFGPGGRHQIVAVSRLVRDEIIRYYGCEPERIAVVYNGVDLAKFNLSLREEFRGPVRSELGLEPDDVMLLFLGHNFKRKGLHALIRALPFLRGRGTRFRLVVVGKGRRLLCDRLARELGVSGLVHYAGVTAAPEKYYAAADVFCFPSYYDPCANVVLEALACGLPVVTSTSNGSGEILAQGQEGYVVDPDDAQKMAECIGGFFDRERREEASRAARRLAESRPLERNFREIMAVYETVLERRRGEGSEQMAPGT